MPEPGWPWPAAPQGAAGDDALALARAAARVFAGSEGDMVLAHLKALTVDRCVGPDTPGRALRALEGQRALVHHLLSLIARGRHG